MKYPLVRELAADGIPVTVTCRVLKLARAPYYRWLVRTWVTRASSVTTVCIERPGSFEFILMYTDSFGCTRMTSSLRGMSLKIPDVTSRN